MKLTVTYFENFKEEFSGLIILVEYIPRAL